MVALADVQNLQVLLFQQRRAGKLDAGVRLDTQEAGRSRDIALGGEGNEGGGVGKEHPGGDGRVVRLACLSHDC